MSTLHAIETMLSFPKQTIVLRGHTKRITAICFSPNGENILSTSADNTAINWNASNGEIIRTSSHLCDEARVLVWSPSGDILLASGRDGTRVYCLDTGKILATMKGITGEVAWSPTGELVLAELDGTVEIWNPAMGKLLRTIFLPSCSSCGFWNDGYYWKWGCDFTSDGTLVITGRSHTTAIIIRNADKTSSTTVKLPKDHSHHKDYFKHKGYFKYLVVVVLSPTGDFVATGTIDGTVRIWKASNGSKIQTLTGHSDEVCAIAWSPREDFILSSSKDHTVRIWSVTTGETLQILAHHKDPLCWSPKGDQIVTVGVDETVAIVSVVISNEENKVNANVSKVNSNGPTNGLVLRTPSVPYVDDSSSGLALHVYDSSSSSAPLSANIQHDLVLHVDDSSSVLALHVDDSSSTSAPLSANATKDSNENNSKGIYDGLVHSPTEPKVSCLKQAWKVFFNSVLARLLLLRDYFKDVIM